MITATSYGEGRERTAFAQPCTLMALVKSGKPLADVIIVRRDVLVVGRGYVLALGRHGLDAALNDSEDLQNGKMVGGP